MVGRVRRRVEFALLGECRPLVEILLERHGERREQRRQGHRQANHDQEQLSGLGRHHLRCHREASRDERELAAPPEHHRQADRRPPREAEGERQPAEHARLDERQPDHRAENRQGARDDGPGVDLHAYADEEQAEQQALERLDVEFDLVPVGGVGQQQSREEGAEGHRQAGHPRDRRDHEDGEQRRRHQDLGAARGGHDPVQRPQQESTGQHDDADRPHGLGHRQGEVDGDALLTIAEDRDQHEDRHDREVLEEQHREACTPVLCGELAPLHQDLHDDGRR